MKRHLLPYTRSQALQLEQGEVIFLPHHSFSLTAWERTLLQPDCVKPGAKSIKFSSEEKKIWGATALYQHSPVLADMLQRYADFAQALVERLLPEYAPALMRSHTSFRPVEAENRIQSRRHDDRLLHIDAFPSRPMHGRRILRVFTNIHPDGRARLWNTGEAFVKVAARFLPHIRRPLPGAAALLHKFNLTKEKRSLYDHYMLHIHDRMKRDSAYQNSVPRRCLSFPAGSSWMVFSDQVSHAAISGQHAMEQTFLLPPEAMISAARSPLRVLEALRGQPLV